MAEPTPWARWLSAAFACGLTPDAFWRLSLREWAMLQAETGPGPLGRAAFEDLAARFPDDSNG